MAHWSVPYPAAIGAGTEFVYGLIEGGVGIPKAVEIAIERVAYLGGKVQVERLRGPEHRPAPAFLKPRQSDADRMNA